MNFWSVDGVLKRGILLMADAEKTGKLLMAEAEQRGKQLFREASDAIDEGKRRMAS